VQRNDGELSRLGRAETPARRLDADDALRPALVRVLFMKTKHTLHL
jgi:hypothetical protein